MRKRLCNFSLGEGSCSQTFSCTSGRPATWISGWFSCTGRQDKSDKLYQQKVGVLLPNCPEYAVVVLGVSLFVFNSTRANPRQCVAWNAGTARWSHPHHAQPRLHPTRTCSPGRNMSTMTNRSKISNLFNTTYLIFKETSV